MNNILDCSHHQGVIDWKKVAKSGVKCAIIKATQGVSFVDHLFQENRNKAREQGILVGAYHFSDGLDAINEATHFIKTVGTILEGEILVLDYEIHLSNPDLWCSIFLDYVKLKTGIKPLIYINSSTAKGFSWERVIEKEYKLWIANYGANIGEMGNPPATGKFPSYALWQYTSRGRVDGIVGYVDMNYTKDFEEFKKLGKPPESLKIDAGEVLPPEPTIDVPEPKQDETVSIPVTVTNDPIPMQPSQISMQPVRIENWFILLIRDILNLFK